VDEGPRIYIERLNIRGNTRTRDFVIRREFDVAEGDAFNRALIDRAERRLKNLNYFKTVKITNEPGSAPDRIIVNVDVEEQPTGEMSVSGGYSTADGFMAELSVGERNLLGQGQFAKVAVQYGERARGFELSYAEPFFMGYRLSVGGDIYYRQQLASNYVSYESKTMGAGLRAGFALSEELAMQLRYNIYRQEITLPVPLNNCQFSQVAKTYRETGLFENPDTPGVDYPSFNKAERATSPNCYTDGEASLAVRRELAGGPVLTSMIGYSLTYNTLDNIRNPTSGIIVEFKQDFAGVGGDVNFIRSSIETRSYYEVFSDIVALLRLQAGHIAGWGGQQLRTLDHFLMGPNLVRGFAPAGIGPRDMTVGGNQDPLGGTMFWGASLEAQAPFSFLPRDVGIKGAVFADAGSLWDYKGATSWDVTGEVLTPGGNNMVVRASVGAGIIWNSPFGPMRFDYAFPLAKWCGTNTASGQVCDRVQQFRFGGATRF
jgi:outer membrane protein insertion porin family